MAQKVPIEQESNGLASWGSQGGPGGFENFLAFLVLVLASASLVRVGCLGL